MMDRSDYHWLISLIWYVLYSVNHDGLALLISIVFLGLSVYSSWSERRKKKNAKPSYSLTFNFGEGEDAKKRRNKVAEDYQSMVDNDEVEVKK